MFTTLPYLLHFAWVILLSVSAFGQFDPHAGMIRSFTEGAAVSVSSVTPGSSALNIIDGNSGTFWQSNGALPTGYLVREDLNMLLGLGGTPSCSNSGSVPDGALTDADVYTGAIIPEVGGEAWVKFNLGTTLPFRSLSLKAGISMDSISIWLYEPSGDSTKIGAYYDADSYSTKSFFLPDTITSIRLVSATQFTISEVGALSKVPNEYAIVDLGSIQNIGWIETRHYAGSDVTSSAIYLSSDSIFWTKIADIDPLALSMISKRLPNPVPARYIKLEHTMVEANYKKAEIWEIRAYDRFGPFGSFPPPEPNPNSLSNMFGINGIWGWGHGVYSDLLSPTEGPFQHARLSAHARNYHNLSWDVNDPDDVPDFSGMPGSLAQWWLDWDREYLIWDSAGLDVYASIQFNNDTQPDSTWDDPYQAAYNYGYAFASHFGPGSGNGLVKRLEVGNEPWHYDAAFYREVLQGMAEGAKAADPDLQVFPCALQAADSTAESAFFMNYAGARLVDSVAPFIDGLNGHYYSYYNDSNGTRRATYPEDYLSFMRSVVNDIRFRDANFPGKMMVVSEWGWDSDGAGESCTHNECVSEFAQAVYGVRYALMLNRLGIDNMTWFFYANTDAASSLYTRSGLTGSGATSFAEKRAFTAFEALLHHLGDQYFLDTIQENDDHWIYLFGDSSGTASYLVGWKPLDESDGSTTSATISIPYPADSAWTISGLSPTGTVTSTPSYSAGSMILPLSGTPLVVRLLNSPTAISLQEPDNELFTYPNPTKGTVRIHGISDVNAILVLKDCFGKQIRSWKGIQSELNISDLSQGTYLLHVQFKTTTSVLKIIKVQ